MGIIFAALMIWERRSTFTNNVERENYVSFESERRPRESTFKGIALGDMKKMQEDSQASSRDEHMAL